MYRSSKRFFKSVLPAITFAAPCIILYSSPYSNNFFENFFNLKNELEVSKLSSSNNVNNIEKPLFKTFYLQAYNSFNITYESIINVFDKYKNSQLSTNNNSFSSFLMNAPILCDDTPKQNSGYYISPMMKLSFPYSLSVPPTDEKFVTNSMDFLAAAPKCFKNLCLINATRIYTMGFYLDKNDVSSKFSNDLICSQPSLLLNPDVDKCLRIVFNASSSHTIKGFAASMTSVLPIDEKEKREGEKAILEFKNALQGLRIEKNSVLLFKFESKPDYRVILFYSPNGESSYEIIGKINSKVFHYMLHELYMQKLDGSKAVNSSMTDIYTKGIKESFSE